MRKRQLLFCSCLFRAVRSDLRRWHAVRDSHASGFLTGKPDKCIDQFSNWSMKAPPGLSDMIRIPYFQRNVPKSGIPERVSRFLARRKGFEPLRSLPLRALLRSFFPLRSKNAPRFEVRGSIFPPNMQNTGHPNGCPVFWHAVRDSNP